MRVQPLAQISSSNRSRPWRSCPSRRFASRRFRICTASARAPHRGSSSSASSRPSGTGRSRSKKRSLSLGTGLWSSFSIRARRTPSTGGILQHVDGEPLPGKSSSAQTSPAGTGLSHILREEATIVLLGFTMKVIENTEHAERKSRGSALRRSLEMAAIAGFYVVAAKLGFTLAFVAEQVTVVWAPTGIALAALLLLGYRVWPAIYLGALLANLTAHEHVATAAAIALGNTLEAVIAALVLRSFVHFDNSLARVKDVVGLAATAMTCTVVSATIGATSLCVAGHQTWALYGETWFVWWLGDFMGALVAAPVLLTWSGLSLPFTRAREAVALVIVAVGINALVFGPPFISPTPLYAELQYTVFPIVIWAALRFGPPGAALVTLVSSIVSILGTAHGYGPFASRTTHQSLMLLQVFMSVVAG